MKIIKYFFEFVTIISLFCIFKIIGLKNNIYSSFDRYINQKYKVEINYKTLERLKNYLR